MEVQILSTAPNSFGDRTSLQAVVAERQTHHLEGVAGRLVWVQIPPTAPKQKITPHTWCFFYVKKFAVFNEKLLNSQFIFFPRQMRQGKGGRRRKREQVLKNCGGGQFPREKRGKAMKDGPIKLLTKKWQLLLAFFVTIFLFFSGLAVLSQQDDVSADRRSLAKEQEIFAASQKKVIENEMVEAVQHLLILRQVPSSKLTCSRRPRQKDWKRSGASLPGKFANIITSAIWT